MDNTQLINNIAIIIVLSLPLIFGVALILGAPRLIRAQMRFMTRGNIEHLEPSRAAIMGIRVFGILVIVIPYGTILLGVLATLHP